MGAPAPDGGVVLDDPEGEVDGDALAAEVVGAFEACVRFEEVPEVAADSHFLAGDRRRGEMRGFDHRRRFTRRWCGTFYFNLK